MLCIALLHQPSVSHSSFHPAAASLLRRPLNVHASSSACSVHLTGPRRLQQHRAVSAVQSSMGCWRIGSESTDASRKALPDTRQLAVTVSSQRATKIAGAEECIVSMTATRPLRSESRAELRGSREKRNRSCLDVTITLTPRPLSTSLQLRCGRTHDAPDVTITVHLCHTTHNTAAVD